MLRNMYIYFFGIITTESPPAERVDSRRPLEGGWNIDYMNFEVMVARNRMNIRRPRFNVTI